MVLVRPWYFKISLLWSAGKYRERERVERAYRPHSWKMAHAPGFRGSDEEQLPPREGFTEFQIPTSFGHHFLLLDPAFRLNLHVLPFEVSVSNLSNWQICTSIPVSNTDRHIRH